MADRGFQDYASSGEASELFLGGILPEHEVHAIGFTGLMTFNNSTDLSIPLVTTFGKIDIFDTIAVNSARGHMTYDSGLARLIVNTSGVYRFIADGSFQLSNNVDIEYAFYLNGVIVNPNNNPIFTGLGNKNVSMVANRAMNLTAGDYLEIWAKVSSDNTLTIKSSNISVEKTDY